MENLFHRRKFSSASRGRFTLENSVHREKPGSPRRIQFGVKNRETGEPRLPIRCSPEIDIRGWIEGNGGKMIARDRYRESGPILEPPRENRFPWSSYLKSGIPVRVTCADWALRLPCYRASTKLLSVTLCSFVLLLDLLPRPQLRSPCPVVPRANSLSCNWVFSPAIRRPRYIYVGCKKEERERKEVKGRETYGYRTCDKETRRGKGGKGTGTSRIKHDNVWPMSRPWLTKVLTSSL